MKIQIYSDLHLEFAPFEVPDLGADVLVLAGDIGEGLTGFDFAMEAAQRQPVIYVLGNHEYYRQSVPGLSQTYREAARGTDLHVLEDDEVMIHGVRFVGSTLWTDFYLNGAAKRAQAMAYAERCLYDFELIRRSEDGEVFTAADSARLHEKSIEYLDRALVEEVGEEEGTVLVTHHAPSHASVAPFHEGDRLSPAFVSDLSAHIASWMPTVWIHGHTHYNVDYVEMGTRVVSNQRGYRGEGVRGFRPELIVEV